MENLKPNFFQSCGNCCICEHDLGHSGYSVSVSGSVSLSVSSLIYSSNPYFLGDHTGEAWCAQEVEVWE